MYQEGTGEIMKAPEIYMELDIRELCLTDWDELCECLCSKVFLIYRTIITLGSETRRSTPNYANFLTGNIKKKKKKCTMLSKDI